HWRCELAGALTSPGYEVNDLGFSYRTDRKDMQGSLRYVQNKPGNVVRRWQLQNVVRSEHNYAWQPILTFAFSALNAQTVNYWTIAPNVQRYFRANDDRLTRGGPLATRPGWTTIQLFVQTDARKPVTFETSDGYTWTEAKGWTEILSFAVGFKSSTWWNLTVGPALTRALFPAQFVTRVPDPSYTPTYGVRYVFVPLDHTEVGLDTRFNAAFTPTVSPDMYARPQPRGGNY